MATDEPQQQWLTLPVGSAERTGRVGGEIVGEMEIYTNAVRARPRARVVGDVNGAKTVAIAIITVWLRRTSGQNAAVIARSSHARANRVSTPRRPRGAGGPEIQRSLGVSTTCELPTTFVIASVFSPLSASDVRSTSYTYDVWLRTVIRLFVPCCFRIELYTIYRKYARLLRLIAATSWDAVSYVPRLRTLFKGVYCGIKKENVHYY